MKLLKLRKQVLDKRISEVPLIDPHPDGYGDNLQNPDVAISKGRPQSGRYKTFMETLRAKQKIHCSRCGSETHNISTCTVIADNVAKAQRQKSTQKSASGPLDFFSVLLNL